MHIFVFLHNTIKNASGGVKTLFQLVNTLNKVGYSASIMLPDHCDVTYQPILFSSKVPVTNDINRITKEDLVIIHEEGIWAFNQLNEKTSNYIIINQGAQCTLGSGWGYLDTHRIYNGALGIITVSEYVSSCIEKLFQIPKSKIFRILFFSSFERIGQ